MTNDNEQLENESRRKFLETAGKAAVVAPAVTLLLTAEQASAQFDPYESESTIN
ncbi:hypothetical protein HBA55_11195 [Pseudomaricurvus alkylphenolicus]|jgi:hypothetical protein|uniref:hypothetical protein n=1 Tax=Pseudomaricurvus alkylphenolicus TaxID=1306991 RepID=UPI001424505F|nr:hypothetical protein [Pseudomaricurvus alkylphenolicus]NIB40155.1 hypothetical protein [Pseudomaricurvus alkylphenolicus]